jgi:hypothetical protein
LVLAPARWRRHQERLRRDHRHLRVESSIERLSEGIIEANASTPNRLPDPQPFQDSSELGGSIVASPVRMEYGISGKIKVPGSHPDRRRDQRRLVVIVHRPAGNFAGRAVK